MASQQRFRIALRRGRVRAEAQAAAAARALGYELRRQHFYQPFPDVKRLPESLWISELAPAGIDLRIDSAATLVRELSGYTQEFPTLGFPIPNSSYEWGDAETLYGMLRHLKPRRLIELGSGASSHLIALTQATNAQDGSPFVFESYDPFVGWHEMGTVDGAIIHPVAAEDIDPSVVEVLEPNDVLFVDTTHTVKTGGDVVHIVLKVLPRVPAGVYVHFHDIFLPYEYPRDWVMQRRRAWAEQYLLHAFLAFNPTFEIVLPVYALWRKRPELMRSAIPTLGAMQGSGPGAFWIRRRMDD